MSVRIIKMPDIGEGIAEAEIVEWQVKVGDLVREDEVLAAVMTDKATVEVPSPCAGKVVALGAGVGEMLAVGSELIRIDAEQAGGDVEPTPTSPEPEPASYTAKPKSEAPEPPPSAATLSDAEKPLAAPPVRKRAQELGIDLSALRGTGPEGRILHEDLDRHLLGRTGKAEAPSAFASSGDEQIKLTGLRRKIAQRMADATRRIAHFSYLEEIDVTELEALRARLNAENADRARLTLLPFLMRAIVLAVADFPQMNAHFDDQAEIIHRFNSVHIGIATQTPAGLIVPVLRDAGTLDPWQMAGEVKRLSAAARDGQASRDELSGSTITLTSLGALGGIASTPVVNPPEVAIIGVNKQVMRPLWDGEQFLPRLTMNLSSSFDHRVIDGMDAASFIQCIKGHLEKPATLMG